MTPVVYSTPPAVGTAKPSNLYADLQSRSLWLGVDPKVEPAGAVLISDIVALQEEIAAGDEVVKAYTDTQISTRAPTVHTHTASQITDFNSAVGVVVGTLPGVNWVPKMIIMWSGSIAELGVGAMVGWALCDGSNGTPDLRDRFILGAGHAVPGVVNPRTSVDTNNHDGHTHVINGHTLILAQTPSHTHTFTGSTNYFETGTASANHRHALWANQAKTNQALNTGSYNWATSSGTFTFDHDYDYSIMGTNEVDATVGLSSDAGAAHYHGVYVTPYGSNNYQGGGESHNHTMKLDGAHKHTITSLNLRDAIPYYAMAYIMKLP